MLVLGMVLVTRGYSVQRTPKALLTALGERSARGLELGDSDRTLTLKVVPRILGCLGAPAAESHQLSVLGGQSKLGLVSHRSRVPPLFSDYTKAPSFFVLDDSEQAFGDWDLFARIFQSLDLVLCHRPTVRSLLIIC